MVQVTAADAHDVVQLLQESLLDVYTDEVGAIDSSRKGGISLAKQVPISMHVYFICRSIYTVDMY